MKSGSYNDKKMESKGKGKRYVEIEINMMKMPKKPTKRKWRDLSDHAFYIETIRIANQP